MFESNNEHCWVILGRLDGDLWCGRMCKMTSGGPVSVDFDAKWVMEREEKRGDVIGFLHTHPNMIASPSFRDDVTMAAWTLSFGKPLICLIRGEDGLRAWWYMDDESEPEEYQAKRIGRRLFGITPALYEENLDETRQDAKA